MGKLFYGAIAWLELRASSRLAAKTNRQNRHRRLADEKSDRFSETPRIEKFTLLEQGPCKYKSENAIENGNFLNLFNPRPPPREVFPPRRLSHRGEPAKRVNPLRARVVGRCVTGRPRRTGVLVLGLFGFASIELRASPWESAMS